jgi:hypothetical protein
MQPETVTDSSEPSGARRLGDDAVVLDVELLLRAGAVLAFDDEVGGGEDGFEGGVVAAAVVALLHQEGLEGVGRAWCLGSSPCQMTLDSSPAAPASESSMVKTPGNSS